MASSGILDRDVLAAYLAAAGPPRGDGFFRILAIADVEAWARSWLDDRKSADRTAGTISSASA